jgi:NAD(P)-dependent dehydrogenase (short-subunit alcohol dehydrogenase family)
MLKRVPIGEFGTEDNVAGAVAYLVSDDAKFVTGQTLVLDGVLRRIEAAKCGARTRRLTAS